MLYLFSKNSGAEKRWPEKCIWPKPSQYGYYFDPVFIPEELDEDGEDLLKIIDYYDDLVDQGVLTQDYVLDEDYFEDEEDRESFLPEMGEEYWEDHAFDYDAWCLDMEAVLSELKIDDGADSPVDEIERILGYSFVNQNLLRQAFTRRSFAMDYYLPGCCEELEFLGDSILNTVVTQEIMKQFCEVDRSILEAPFRSKYDEGELTKLRIHFVCKEHLAERCEALGLDKFILFGSGDELSESSREDVLEALIGAVTMDCQWDMERICAVVDQLVDLHIPYPDRFIGKSYYEILNTWSQKHFGTIPDYEVYRENKEQYCCVVRFQIPQYDDDCICYDREKSSGSTRSKAREQAAMRAYYNICSKGAWMDLRDAGIIPDRENSINQLQELYQKKYLTEKPVYEFEEEPGDQWRAKCIVEAYDGSGIAENKTKAKKKAAYRVLLQIFRSAGMRKEEWIKEIYS